MNSENGFTTPELIACALSRTYRDGERVAVGAGLHVARCGALLAHLLRGPNMRIYAGMTYTNLYAEPTLAPIYTVTDWRFSRFAEGYAVHSEAFDDVRKITDSFVVGGIQIDRYGNSNLIGVGTDPRRLAFRGPGPVGTPSLGDNVERFHLYLASHDRRTLVERCDFVSTVGWGEGGADARRELGLPGGGPELCVTPLCIFDFDDDTKHMRLQSVHPGVSLEDVMDNTGFEPVVPDDVPTTAVPTSEELRTLRGRVDVEGMLRN